MKGGGDRSVMQLQTPSTALWSAWMIPRWWGSRWLSSSSTQEGSWPFHMRSAWCDCEVAAASLTASLSPKLDGQNLACTSCSTKSYGCTRAGHKLCCCGLAGDLQPTNLTLL